MEWSRRRTQHSGYGICYVPMYWLPRNTHWNSKLRWVSNTGRDEETDEGGNKMYKEKHSFLLMMKLFSLKATNPSYILTFDCASRHNHAQSWSNSRIKWKYHPLKEHLASGQKLDCIYFAEKGIIRNKLYLKLFPDAWCTGRVHRQSKPRAGKPLLPCCHKRLQILGKIWQRKKGILRSNCFRNRFLNQPWTPVLNVLYLTKKKMNWHEKLAI